MSVLGVGLWFRRQWPADSGSTAETGFNGLAVEGSDDKNIDTTQPIVTMDHGCQSQVTYAPRWWRAGTKY